MAGDSELRGRSAPPVSFPDFLLYTDPSEFDWGASPLQDSAGGLWDSLERSLPFNMLELRAYVRGFFTLWKW